jgi:hypothetical protein
VLGDEHVDRSLSNVSEFGRPLQELVTTFCWGTTWGRPGLALGSVGRALPHIELEIRDEAGSRSWPGPAARCGCTASTSRGSTPTAPP